MRLGIAADVAWVEDDARSAVYVVRLPDGEPLVLEGSARAVWRAIADGASEVGAVADAAGALTGAQADDAMRADVSRFVDQLRAAGLVAERP